jgi:hypothetical protein
VPLPLRIPVPAEGSTGALDPLVPEGAGRRVPRTPAMRVAVAAAGGQP